MTIRALSLPKDLVPLEDMLVRTFQYPDNPEWGIQADEEEDIAREIKTLRRLWPVIRILQTVIPSLRDLMRGFVWEEDGQIGAVVMVQRRGKTNTWGVGIVGVLPEFRRRGLARKLLTRALDDLRQRGARHINLGVISKNIPAYGLYKSLGFEHYSSLIDFDHHPEQTPAAIACPRDYDEATISLLDWKPRYELERRITPEDINRYEPVEIGGYRSPLVLRCLNPVMNRLKKTEEKRFVYKHRGVIVGLLRHSTSRTGKGTSSIRVQLDPAHPELASYVLAKGMRAVMAINPSLRIHCTAPTWMTSVVEAAQEYGFSERVRYHALALLP
jgi:ribosomal protein S18 acetylase RimI-like enzyme